MHSTPFSEIAAHACGLVAGLAAYAITGAFTNDHKMRIGASIAASVLCNLIIGGKLNFLMQDFIALILVRPISAYLGVKLLEYVLKSMNGQPPSP